MNIKTEWNLENAVGNMSEDVMRIFVQLKFTGNYNYKIITIKKWNVTCRFILNDENTAQTK